MPPCSHMIQEAQEHAALQSKQSLQRLISSLIVCFLATWRNIISETGSWSVEWRNTHCDDKNFSMAGWRSRRMDSVWTHIFKTITILQPPLLNQLFLSSCVVPWQGSGWCSWWLCGEVRPVWAAAWVPSPDPEAWCNSLVWHGRRSCWSQWHSRVALRREKRRHEYNLLSHVGVQSEQVSCYFSATQLTDTSVVLLKIICTKKISQKRGTFNWKLISLHFCGNTETTMSIIYMVMLLMIKINESNVPDWQTSGVRDPSSLCLRWYNT